MVIDIHMVSVRDVDEANNRIYKMINHTPVHTSNTLDALVGGNIFVKCEIFQKGGSFKFRGVCNKLLQLSDRERRKGVITHSSGNHAQAVALASSILGIKSIVVMPENSPQVKVDATREYGSEIISCDNTVESRESTCMKLQKLHNYTFVHSSDDDQIIAGAGTAAFELISEVGAIDYIFCPVGGGGLLSGTSIASKGLYPKMKVIAVEPEKANDAYKSFKDGKLYPSTYPNTIADGLRTSICERTFNIIQKFVDQIVTVSEKQIINAMRFLWERMKLIVEPSGAVPLAALLSKKVNVNNKKVGIILSGGNIDIEPFFQLLEKRVVKL